MAISVIEILEMIQIEHQDAECLFRAEGTSDFPFKYFLQVPAVV